MSAPTPRHHQQLAAATLARLLTIPAPLCWWNLHDPDSPISGMLGGGLDRARVELHQWAAILDEPVWRLEAEARPSGDREIRVTGRFESRAVEIWVLARVPDVVTVEELSAPPQVDSPSCAPATPGAPGPCVYCGTREGTDLHFDFDDEPVRRCEGCGPCMCRKGDRDLCPVHTYPDEPVDEGPTRAGLDAVERQCAAIGEALAPLCTCDGSDPCPVHSWPVEDLAEVCRG